MDKEKFKKLDIKPKFNLTYYKNDERYSDGSIENRIIDILADNEPEDYARAVIENYCWPVYYHLTPLRKNILSWYPFEKNKDVLEIGCGFGAITNMLCDKCNTVTSVELTKRRATGTLIRCRHRDNLEIIVGNLNDIEFERSFDYITLIGVLEYQGTYTESDNPYVDFLNKIRKLLKPGGKLLIAIENKYGLKYWCGAREDHTGIPFDSINQYKLGNRTAVTFSKKELDNIIETAGFEWRHFYYPYPDYKMPTVVFSEKEKITIGKMGNVAPYYVPDGNSLIANEKDIYTDLIDNNEMAFFANSYLVECATENMNLGKITYALLNNRRKRGLNVGTLFTDDGKVIKWNNENNDITHINKTLENQNYLKEQGLRVVEADIKENRLIMDKIVGNSLEDLFIDNYLRMNAEGIIELYNYYLTQIINSSERAEAGNNIILDFTTVKNINYGIVLKNGMFDMIPRNAFIIDNEAAWFDQEWKIENVPARFIFYHGVKEMYFSNPWMENILNFADVILNYEITKEEQKEYDSLMIRFANEIMDENVQRADSVYRSIDYSKIIDNISYLRDGEAAAEKLDIKKIEEMITTLLSNGMYNELIKLIGNISIDNVKNFEFKVLITWVNNHIYELSEGKNNIIKYVGSYKELVDKILKNI
ncbi:MAG: class I SAM-dependent methyltransferase [Lachnospiraceae bacterium]|nr:class I SAM-dependent methyltransferase [Lachnospiraceae bacterium]